MTKIFKSHIADFKTGNYKKENLLKFSEILLENSNNIFYEHDLEGDLIFISKQVKEILGYDSDKIEKKWQTFLTESSENDAAYLSKKKAITEKKKQPPYEVEVYSKSGEKVWFEIRETPVIKKGNVVSVAGAAINISERKKAELALNVSEERFTKAFYASPDSITISSIKEGILLEVNNGFERVFGYSKSFVVGKTTIGLGLWKNLIDRDNCLKLLKENGHVRNYAADYLAKDGRTGTAEVSMEYISIGDEDFLLTIVRDITERMKIEKELKASEEKFKTAFYSRPDANVISRKQDRKIIDINPAFEKIFEYGRKETIGRTFEELNLYTPAEDIEKELRSINNGNLKSSTVNYLTKNGKKGFAQIVTEEIKIADETCLITSINDITEQIKTQKAIAEYQEKLKILSSEITLTEERERRKIAADLHDNLGQYLAMIKIRLAEAEKQENIADTFLKIKEARGFLDKAIIGSRSITYELSPPVLYDLGFSAAIRWKLETVEREHNIKTVFEDCADSIRLENKVRVLLFRAVLEIINNSLKHSKASELVIKINNDKEKLFLEITDNGIGFNRQEAELKAAINRSFGLFSIRERISYLKGSLVIDSKLNEGTSISISIPYKNTNRREDESKNNIG